MKRQVAALTSQMQICLSRAPEAKMIGTSSDAVPPIETSPPFTCCCCTAPFSLFTAAAAMALAAWGLFDAIQATHSTTCSWPCNTARALQSRTLPPIVHTRTTWSLEQLASRLPSEFGRTHRIHSRCSVSVFTQYLWKCTDKCSMAFIKLINVDQTCNFKTPNAMHHATRLLKFGQGGVSTWECIVEWSEF